MNKRLYVVFVLLIAAAIVLAGCAPATPAQSSSAPNALEASSEEYSKRVVQLELHANADGKTSIVRVFVRVPDPQPKSVTLKTADGNEFILTPNQEYSNLELTLGNMLGHGKENTLVVWGIEYKLIYQAGDDVKFDYFISKEEFIP